MYDLRITRRGLIRAAGPSAVAALVWPNNAHAQQTHAIIEAGPGPGGDIRRRDGAAVIQSAPGTRYRIISPKEPRSTGAIRLDEGALLLEFSPRDQMRSYQIETPHAIAAVRGTKWAVDVSPAKTSVLVVTGSVVVARLGEPTGLVLEPGLGIDVASDGVPLTVKRWSPQRVDALLSRFGR